MKLAIGTVLAVFLLMAGLVHAVLSLPPDATGLRDAVDARLAESGVQSPVTAVLLNFRGYDTMLEIGVLLLAAVGVRAAGGEPRTAPAVRGVVLTGMLRVLVPLIVLAGAYLVWTGARAPGGAFQAGAVLAAGGILLLVGDVRWFGRWPDTIQRVLLGAGLIVFVAVAVAVMTGERHLLEYPRPWAGRLIVLIELAATVSIALVLCELFNGGPLSTGNDGGDSPAGGNRT